MISPCCNIIRLILKVWKDYELSRDEMLTELGALSLTLKRQPEHRDQVKQRLDYNAEKVRHQMTVLLWKCDIYICEILYPFTWTIYSLNFGLPLDMEMCTTLIHVLLLVL